MGIFGFVEMFENNLVNGNDQPHLGEPWILRTSKLPNAFKKPDRSADVRQTFGTSLLWVGCRTRRRTGWDGHELNAGAWTIEKNHDTLHDGTFHLTIGSLQSPIGNTWGLSMFTG